MRDYKEVAIYIANNIHEAIETWGVAARLDRIIQPAPKVNTSCVKREEIYKNGSICPLGIVGCYASPFIGKTWKDLLLSDTEKMQLNLLLLKRHPEYYFSSQLKEPPITVVCYNGEGYVRDHGLHRVAIARLFFAALGDPFMKLEGVSLVVLEIDNLAVKVRDFLIDLSWKGRFPIQVSFLREPVGKEEDTESLDRVEHVYSVKLKIQTLAGEIVISPQEAAMLAGELEKGVEQKLSGKKVKVNTLWQDFVKKTLE